VALCRENDVQVQTGLDKLLARIGNDIKQLETQGLVVNGVSYKGSIFAVLGDNLGSHFIGGFTENFSTSEYLCRFCHATRAEFHANLYCVGSSRSPLSYDNEAKAMANNQLGFCLFVCLTAHQHI
jgi:hypothetical protein